MPDEYRTSVRSVSQCDLFGASYRVGTVAVVAAVPRRRGEPIEVRGEESVVLFEIEFAALGGIGPVNMWLNAVVSSSLPKTSTRMMFSVKISSTQRSVMETAEKTGPIKTLVTLLV